MASARLTVRIDSVVKQRLEKLAKSTGRSRSFLVAEAIGEYVDVNEWQVAGIRQAMQSMDRGEGIPHHEVMAWVRSWGERRQRPRPRSRKA